MKSAVTYRYATALIELAEESKIMAQVEKDLNALLVMLKESADLSALIHSPVLSAARQEAAMLAVAEKAGFQDMTKSFLGVLVRNRRLNVLPAVIGAVKDSLSARRGEIVANVQTAQALSKAQAKALQDALSKNLGSAVQLNAKIEPGILGGMIVTVGSQMIDDSVARKLERLQAAMRAQANQNSESGGSSKSKSKPKTKKKEA